MATKKTAAANSSRTATKKKAAKSANKKVGGLPKPRRASKRTAASKTASKAGDAEVTIDRRRSDRRKKKSAEEGEPTPTIERRKKVQRRRQIDPTTCERDYTEVEVEFMNAMNEYKRRSGRMFPTCSEVLEVIRDLGYVKLSPAGRALLEQSSLADCESENDSAADDPATGLSDSSEQFGGSGETDPFHHQPEPLETLG